MEVEEGFTKIGMRGNLRMEEFWNLQLALAKEEQGKGPKPLKPSG